VDASDAVIRPDGSCSFSGPDEDGSADWATLADWAVAWIAEWRNHEHGAACEFIDSACSDAIPGVVDALIVLAETADGNAEVLSWVGAGPLEDLVSHTGNGLRVLDEIDTAARQNPAFRRALTGVWLGFDLPDPVRTRLAQYGARDFVAEHAMSQAELAVYLAQRRTRGFLGQGEG
jgi:hypothetical protein